MIDTMREGERPGVGLAAPQVGESLAIIVAQPPPDYEGTEAIHRGAVVIVNGDNDPLRPTAPRGETYTSMMAPRPINMNSWNINTIILL